MHDVRLPERISKEKRQTPAPALLSRLGASALLFGSTLSSSADRVRACPGRNRW